MTPQEQITSELIGKVHRMLEATRVVSAKTTELQVTEYSNSRITAVTLDLGQNMKLRLSLDEPLAVAQ